MFAHDVVQPIPSEGTCRATGEGPSKNGKQSQRFSAQKQMEVVLRLLRGDDLALLARELGLPAARLATWREAFLDAGQEAMKKQPRDVRDREIVRVREKLGESTMEIELLQEKIARMEAGRPLRRRRSRQ
jgi:transposase